MKTELARIYIACWSAACLLAVVLVARERRAYALLSAAYARYLAAPWKLATFGVATAFLVLAAPWAGDPTWDAFDALFMSVLTYTTAPWSVGALFLVARRRLPARQGYVAACMWLFSASFSYDLYIWLRMGFYPSSWAANLVASSVLYAAAGLMWNLAWIEGRGLQFGFMVEGWPALDASRRIGRVLAFAAVFMLLVAGMMLPFFWGELTGR